MWSHEISAATGSFTQQALLQGAYARQINPFDNRAQAENITGNMINRGVGFAAPIAKFGGGMLGLDSPFSGAMTFGSIGAMMGGPMGAGIGAGLGAGIGMAGAAAQFGVGNFMTGMQQQQGLNSMLRQNYGLMRPGGYGFSGGEMGHIGQQIRGMTHQVGPGGEMQNFSELSQLAANMGRMGYAQNVTDVRQFSQKFRQMVDTLKTVSKELGTSLQGAQEMVVGMRQSGIFNQADQIRMAAGIRQNNMAGVSMEASGQMANVGSQIARSIGGLGRSGAFAGMRTIQQVGAAVKTGALSEEDIYNATGLTGEQGQMAMAQNQLQSSAGFLRSGRGRHLLASLAGRNGQLNENALDEFMGGGFGVGRTRQLAGQNLGQIGRAGFLRNEGRLRGEVLNRVGGNVNTLALMGWAGERGVDISAMGDREMLFAQRMLGMGRDEMDVSVKQANAMGDMSTFMKKQGMEDSYLKNQAMVRKNVGLEGLKNTFNQFREHAQSDVQAYGAKAYQDMSNWVERQLNKLMGTYTVELDKKLDDAYTSYIASGGQGRGAASTIQRSRQMLSAGFGGASMPGGGGGLSIDQYRKVAQGGTYGGASSLLGKFMGAQTLEDKTGYHFTTSFKNNTDQQQAQLEAYGRWSQAFARGANQSPTKDNVGAIVSLSRALSSAGAAQATGDKQGPERARAALSYAAARGDKQAQKLSGMMNSGRPGDAEKAASIVNASLINAGQRGVAGQTPFDFLTGGGPGTSQDRDRWLSEPMSEGFSKKEEAKSLWQWAKDIGQTVLIPAMGIARLIRGSVSDSKVDVSRDQFGARLASREGKEQLFGAMSGNSADIAQAHKEWNAEMGKRREGDVETADATFAKLKITVGLLGPNGLKQLQEQEAKGQPPALGAYYGKKLQTEFDKGENEANALALNALHTMQRVSAEDKKAHDDVMRKQSDMARRELSEGAASGLYANTGDLTAGTQEAYNKMGLGWVGKMRQLHGATLAAVQSGNEHDIQEAVEMERHGPLEGKSSQELFKMAADDRNRPQGASETDAEYQGRLRSASMVSMEGKARMAAGGSQRKYGEGLSASKWLGLDVDRGVQQRLSSARGDIKKEMAILTTEGGLSLDADKDIRAEQEKHIEHALRVTSGKKNLGYSEKEMDAMTYEQRKEIRSYNDQGKEERAQHGREEMRGVGRDQAARKEEDRKKNDPQLKALDDIKLSLNKLVTLVGTEATSSGAKHVIIDNKALVITPEYS
jgi:hypothetical protein